MEASTSIYNQQKGISEYKVLKKYSTTLKIETVINKGDTIFFKDNEGKWYSHRLDFKNGTWNDYLKVGNNVKVFVVERKVKDKIYLNVYPNHYSRDVLVSDDDM